MSLFNTTDVYTTSGTNTTSVPWTGEVPDFGFQIAGTILVGTFFFGLMESMCVFLIFLKNPKLRSPTNMFIIGMTVCDAGILTFGNIWGGISCFYFEWPFGDIACKAYGFVMFFLGLTQLYLLCAVSVDRYIVIVKPLMTPKITHKVAYISIGICYLGGLLWSGLPFIGMNRYTYEGPTFCSIDWFQRSVIDDVYVILIFAFCYVIPVILMAFCYINIYMQVSARSICTFKYVKMWVFQLWFHGYQKLTDNHIFQDLIGSVNNITISNTLLSL